METKFLSEFKNALDITREINLDDDFRSLPEWNSIAHMSLIAMLDSEFNMQIERSLFDKCKTIRDIVELVKANHNK